MNTPDSSVQGAPSEGPPSIPFSCLPLGLQTKRRDLQGLGVEFKAVPCEFKTDRPKRRYEGFYASYGTVDKGDDMLLENSGGAYLKHRWENHLIKSFWDHEIPCGPRPDVLEEHKEGLFASGVITDHPQFDLLLAQMEDGTIRHGSIGWINRGSEKKSIGGRMVRVVSAYEPVEISHCYYPMNEKTSVMLAKALGNLAEAVERKSLYGLAEAVYALASARSAMDYVDRLLNPEPALSEQEAGIVERLWQEAASLSTTAEGLYKAKCQAPAAPAPVIIPPAADHLYETAKRAIEAVFADRKSAFAIPTVT